MYTINLTPAERSKIVNLLDQKAREQTTWSNSTDDVALKQLLRTRSAEYSALALKLLEA